jgi:adenylate cyclase
LRMGIGLNSGPVMSGNVGSERRLEYAAVGDTTNVAARLEAETKRAGQALLLSDATRRALTRGHAGLVELGPVTLRGRDAPTVLWTLAAGAHEGANGRSAASVATEPAGAAP